MAERSINREDCDCALRRLNTSSRRRAFPAAARATKSSRSPSGTSRAASSRASTCFQSSGFMVSGGAQFPVEPGLGLAPLTHHGDGRDAQHLGGLFDGQPAEETQLHDPTLTLVNTRKVIQRLVQR